MFLFLAAEVKVDRMKANSAKVVTIFENWINGVVATIEKVPKFGFES